METVRQRWDQSDGAVTGRKKARTYREESGHFCLPVGPACRLLLLCNLLCGLLHRLLCRGLLYSLLYSLLCSFLSCQWITSRCWFFTSWSSLVADRFSQSGLTAAQSTQTLRGRVQWRLFCPLFNCPLGRSLLYRGLLGRRLLLRICFLGNGLFLRRRLFGHRLLRGLRRSNRLLRGLRLRGCLLRGLLDGPRRSTRLAHLRRLR